MNLRGLFTYLKIKVKNKTIFVSGLVGLAVGVLLFLSSTAIIYRNNAVEYIPYDYMDFFPMLVKYAIVTLLLITIILVIIPERCRIFLTTLLLSCAFFAWFRSTTLVWDYGILNGVEINWKNKQTYVGVDIILWTCLFTIVAAQFRKIYNKIIPISILFIVLQLSLVIPVLSNVQNKELPDAQNRIQKIVVDNSREFDFGDRKNVLIFILDSFGEDIFKEALEKNPEYGEIFDGFTFYENSLAGFPTTYYTPTLILTGKYYDQSLPIQEFIETSFDNNSLPLILKEKGYLVHIPRDITVTSSKLIASNYVYASDTTKKLLQTNKATLNRGVFNLLYPAYFRLSPAFTKKFVWYWGEQRVPQRSMDRGDYEYLKKFTKNSQIVADENTFKYIHLWGIHPPYTINENYIFEPMKLNQKNVLRKALLNLKYMESVIGKLKELGIYDNTLLMFLGDHGIETSGDIEEPTDRLVSQSIPLVAIKWLGDKGPVKISKAPVSLADITPSILYDLGYDYTSFERPPIQLMNEDDRGNRYFYSYVNDSTLWKSTYVYEMKEFRVVGNSKDEKAWQYTGRTITKNGDKHVTKYRYGETIVFQKGTGQEAYLAYGWSNPEESFTWSNGIKSGIILQTDKPSSEVILRLTLHPFIHPGVVDFQTLIVEFNNHKVINLTIDKPGIYEMVINKEYFNDTTQNLVFKIPKATRVSSLVKESYEHRALGVGLINLTMEPVIN